MRVCVAEVPELTDACRVPTKSRASNLRRFNPATPSASSPRPAISSANIWTRVARLCARLGYKPFYFDSILEQDLYFAGSADARARELEEMFMRDDVRAIVCARGGYGSNYLLDILDLNKIKAHPKIFVGYSDITTLLTYFTDSAGIVTFHGPMVAKDFAHADGVDAGSWEAALTGVFRMGLGARIQT